MEQAKLVQIAQNSEFSQIQFVQGDDDNSKTEDPLFGVTADEWQELCRQAEKKNQEATLKRLRERARERRLHSLYNCYDRDVPREKSDVSGVK